MCRTDVVHVVHSSSSPHSQFPTTIMHMIDDK